MKHLLPILTAALLGAALTVSAANTFDNYAAEYGYYEGADIGKVSTDKPFVQTIDYGSYQIIKTSENYNPSLLYNSRFRIHTDEKVDFYLYDFVDNVQSSNNTGNALAARGISRIGYRMLDENQNVIEGTEKTFDLGSPTSEVVKREYADGTGYDITRNKYHLGEFEAGKDFEIFMSYNADDSEGVWSNSTETPGGYNGGANNELYLKVDKLMAAYMTGKFDYKFGEDIAEDVVAKAMPIASLDPSGTRISFGIQGIAPTGGDKTFGSPLPGGLQIALIAGLFGLGFWYARRRKAIAR